jgi:hypothetical protein
MTTSVDTHEAQQKLCFTDIYILSVNVFMLSYNLMFT